MVLLSSPRRQAAHGAQRIGDDPHEQRSRFLTNGFLVVSDGIGAEMIAGLRVLAEELLALQDFSRSARLRRHSIMLPLDYREERVVRLLTDPGLRESFRRLGLHDVRWLSGYLVSKPPQSPGLWWHQDWWAWDDPLSSRLLPPQVFVNIYLESATSANGCLRVLPGSHRRRLPVHDLLPDAHGETIERLPDDHAAYAWQAGEREVVVQPGDLVLGDVRLLHATHANASARPRHCLVLWFLPQYQDLPRRFRVHYAQHPCQPAVGWALDPGTDVPPQLRGFLPDHPDIEGPAVGFNRTPGSRLPGPRALSARRT